MFSFKIQGGGDGRVTASGGLPIPHIFRFEHNNLLYEMTMPKKIDDLSRT